MLLGTTAAIVHGTGLPLMMLVFGEMIDSFASVGNLAHIKIPNVTSGSEYCSWYWFYWKCEEISVTMNEVCGALTKYALVYSVL